MRSEGRFAYLTAREMAEFDRTAIEDFGIDELLLMENAGVSVAVVARRMLGGSVAGRTVRVLAGKGNNGGDGLVAARHLCNWGAKISLILGGERAELRTNPPRQMAMLEKLGVGSSGPEGGVPEADLLVDALLGYNARGDPKEPLAGLIRGANLSRASTLAVDLPSGLDATTGEPGSPCIKADSTVTLGLPKTGFLNPEARDYVGTLYVADISFPDQIYRKYSQDRGVFAEEAIVRVW